MVNYDDILKNSSRQPVNIKLTPEDECGLYFTSGTTGSPKPVLLTHKNMTFAAKIEQPTIIRPTEIILFFCLLFTIPEPKCTGSAA